MVLWGCQNKSPVPSYHNRWRAIERMNRIAPALSAALWDGRWSSEGDFRLGKGASGEGVEPSSSELETEVLPLDDPGVAGTPAML